ncbi:MAG TPA: hypothetical protein VFQ45_14070, partial [Longimicrobium sp.]|nr:hypothetical protein [Longimicrobium sp.]
MSSAKSRGPMAGVMRRVIPWKRREGADYHWFDHPEMQARIAKAEADLREGRSRTFHSADEVIAYL